MQCALNARNRGGGCIQRRAPASAFSTSWPVQRVWHARRSLLNTDSVDFGSAIEFPARAAVLGMEPDDFKKVVGLMPATAYMEPSRLFCVKQLADLLGSNVIEVLSAMEQQPKLCNITVADVEQLLEELQTYLDLPRPQVAQLMMQDYQLMLMSLRDIDNQLQRICNKCQLPLEYATKLATLAPAVLISNASQTCTDVLNLASMLDVPPTTALDVLAIEQQYFGNARQLLADMPSIEASWRSFSQQAGVGQSHCMQAMLQHLLCMKPRYSLCQLPQLSDDVASIAAQSHLQPAFVCGMVLAAPGVVDVPNVFWVLLMDHILVRRPDWHNQLSQLNAGQVGALVLSLLASDRDRIQLEGSDAHFASADIDFNRDLQLLEALAGNDLIQPQFSKSSSGAGVVKAGRTWRLLYLSNPRQASKAEADLQRACSQDTKQFCSVYPGYRHWLYNTAFEMEWRDVPGPALHTWDM